jgi:hypothetical protein
MLIVLEQQKCQPCIIIDADSAGTKNVSQPCIIIDADSAGTKAPSYHHPC